MLSNAQINRLRSAYSSLERCDIPTFDKMKRTLGRLDNADLERLAGSGIPFIDTAANSVLVDRGARGEDARISHAADKIAAKMRARSGSLIGGAA